MKKTLTKILLVASLALPLVALAAPVTVPPSAKTIEQVLDDLATKLLLILGAAAVILVVVAGFQFITAGGDPEKVSSARDKVMYAVIGVLIGGLAWVIVKLIAGVL